MALSGALIMGRRRHRRIEGYLVAIAVVAVEFWARYHAGDLLHNYPILLFFPGVFLVSALYGFGPGAVCALLSGACAATFFIKPMGAIWVADISDIVGVAIFCAIGIGIAAASDALARTQDMLIRSERGKDLLLREVNHRIRNDLAMMSSILSLSRMRSPPKVQCEFDAALGRIEVLNRVYHSLRRANDSTEVSAAEFMGNLVDHLRAIHAGVRPVELRERVEAVLVSQEAATCMGLIINEAVTNAFKYAFPGGRAGVIDVVFVQRGGEFVLTIQDDGVGTAGGAAKGTGLGTRLSDQLSRQIGGSYSTESANGHRVMVRFPAPARERKNLGQEGLALKA